MSFLKLHWSYTKGVFMFLRMYVMLLFIKFICFFPNISMVSFLKYRFLNPFIMHLMRHTWKYKSNLLLNGCNTIVYWIIYSFPINLILHIKLYDLVCSFWNITHENRNLSGLAQRFNSSIYLVCMCSIDICCMNE